MHDPMWVCASRARHLRVGVGQRPQPEGRRIAHAHRASSQAGAAQRGGHVTGGEPRRVLRVVQVHQGQARHSALRRRTHSQAAPLTAAPLAGPRAYSFIYIPTSTQQAAKAAQKAKAQAKAKARLHLHSR